MYRLITGAAFTVLHSFPTRRSSDLSPVVETLAVLVTLGTAPAATLTVSVIVLQAGTAHVSTLVTRTTCITAEPLQPVPVPDTNPSPVGNVSLTVMVPVVAVLPTFVTASEYTPLSPTVKLPV